MIKVQAISDFNFSSMDKISNLKRAKIEKENYIFKNDIFECDKEMADYLLGKNPLNKTVVQVIEVKPEELPTTEEIDKAYEEIEKKPRKKRTSKK